MNLESGIEKIVRSHGAELYDIETTKENDRNIFRVYITQNGGVDLDTCAEISNDLSPLLDVHPPMSGAYFLEVSSPGIERTLKKPRHFRASVGEKVRLKVAGGQKYTGTLEAADDDEIVVRDEKGLRHRIAYAKILKARTYYDW